MNCTNLLKSTLSCFEQQINRPTVLIMNEAIIFSHHLSDDVKYFFYKNESTIKEDSLRISTPTLLQYGTTKWDVFPIETNLKDVRALLFVAHPYHLAVHHYIECLIKLFELMIQKEYKEKLLADQIDQLSEREKQVFFLLMKGYSNQEIARELILSKHTIKNHINSVFQKLEVRRRSQLIAKFSHLL
ncbi:helix-turn-helix transcriptional regulator [Anoxybacillus sp. MB8]|uniref:helix-turn-helix domain-containing protein n=1 Tax=Anoxybacillus sp. MB8 TaxID=2496850 RepID=UPI0009468862|nr:helix-turn-helix transcriptional regulator [Anoxybacillus sp. MB8]